MPLFRDGGQIAKLSKRVFYGMLDCVDAACLEIPLL